MSFFPPANICLIPLFRNHGITKNPMIQAFFHCFQNTRCGRKIHVRHPHRQFIFLHIPLQRCGVSTVNHFIKIACHENFPPYTVSSQIIFVFDGSILSFSKMSFPMLVGFNTLSIVLVICASTVEYSNASVVLINLQSFITK